MVEPSLPNNEKERIQSLHALGILDTPPEERFDRITQTAKEIFQVPIALISIVDVNRQWFKSCIGLDTSETPRGISFCGHAILQNEPFIIPDATKDKRFADNPLVTGAPNIKFYAGIPIAAIDGNNVGTLCIIDDKPRELTKKEVDLLKNLGAWAQLEINSRNISTLAEEQKTLTKEIEAFFSSSYDLMWVSDSDGNFKHVNKTFMRILGYKPTELTNEMFINNVHIDNREEVKDMYDKLNSGASVINKELRFPTKEGVYIWLQLNAIPLDGNVFVTAKNITESKELEIKQQIQQEQYKLITNRFKFATQSAKIGIWEWDIINNRLTWDDQMYALYGINKKSFGGAYEAWQAGLHPDDKKKGDDEIQQALAGEKEFDTSFRVLWPDGTIRTIKAYGTVERDKEGIPKNMVGVNFDITKEAIVDKHKTEFVSLASHQLKTPVGAIRWNLEMLQGGDYGPITDKQMKVVDETYKMSIRMNELINALLNISRIEMGVFIIESTPSDFPKICDEVLLEMKNMIKTKEHKVVKDYDKNLPIVPADDKLLRIIYQNFISNAIKYSPKKGRIKISITTNNENIIISVANNGDPIPEKDQKSIFGKMYRASNAASFDADGNGLGLYLVKNIVENAGGRVWFTSDEGEDTVFSCSFPLSGMIPKTGTKQLL